MKASNNPIEKWLKKLQEESWNLELLISGFSIFLLIQSGDFLSTINQYVRHHFEVESWVAVIFLMLVFLRLAMTLLTFNLIIHIILRGFWIGAIGLRSVQDKVDYEKLRFSPFFTENLKKRISSLDVTLVKLDRICSVIFSFTFLVVCMVVSLFLTFIFFGLFLYLLGILTELDETLFVVILKFTVLGVFLLLLLGGIMYLIDTLSLGFFKKYTWLSKIYYPIYSLFGIITLAGFYRAIYYHLISHFPKRKIQLFLIAYAFIPVLYPFHTLNYYRFFPDQNNPETLDNTVYNDSRKPGEWIEKASIPSMFIKESFLPLFIRYEVSDNENILKWCDDYTPAKSSGFISGIYIGKKGFMLNDPKVEEPDPAKLKECLARFYEVYINDSLFTRQEYYYYKHPNQGELGLQMVFDIRYLERGQHKVSIKTKIINEEEELEKEDYIAFPFWLDK